jgi:hypothetical protein
MDSIGCEQCYPEQPPPNFAFYIRELESEESVIDESHFALRVVRCRNCGQRFVWIFTEFIDWHGGDDAQYVTVAPITSEEATQLIAQGESVDLEWLGSLGEGRRVLIRDHPTGKQDRYAWRSGPFIVMPGY